jgi:translation initiation factor IF-2
MAEQGSIRLSKVLKELNISIHTASEFLESKDVDIDVKPNTKITDEIYEILQDEFETDKSRKKRSEEVSLKKKEEKEAIRAEIQKEEEEKAEPEVVERPSLSGPKMVGKIDLEKKEEVAEETTPEEAPAPEPVEESPVATEETTPEPEVKAEEKAEEEVKEKVEEKVEEKPKETSAEEKKEEKAEEQAPVKGAEKKEEAAEGAEPEVIRTKYEKLSGIKSTGQKIDLSRFERPKKKPEEKEESGDASKRKRRKRIRVDGPSGGGAGKRGKKKREVKPELTEEEIQKQIKETLEKLTGGGSKSKSSKLRREKRQARQEKEQIEEMEREAESMVLRVTEFVTADELAKLMDASVTQIISACMQLGMMVTMNQRLDAETISIVAEEFGYQIEFISAEEEEAVEEEVDDPKDLKPRPPIVTVMGHVDHGKTSLLDHIREANVIAGESGGITQHIGAYAVTLSDGQQIAFIDTPGHEAFTAMRARGAKVTDLAIIVIAADDDVMPQTKEAISHAQAANVPIIIALNKMDRPEANADRVRESLANLNILVEDWGGKVQSQEISAKTGMNVDLLLEKVLLEAELLELKSNPNKMAQGTIIEASLDKGRGYTTTLLVQNGTLKIGDYMLAGQTSGKVKAMFDERGHRVMKAGPSTPVSVLGLDGAPTAGDAFKVMDDEKEAKSIAARRGQLQREQSMRTKKHITLDEIGRRLAIGDFQELNVIVKGDVDGSIEALSDSLQKLSTAEIQVNIIHKGVGQVTESDVLLASASDAIIIAFQVRPSVNARQLAEKEEIDVRTYSIIYDAINDVKDAMEGMLSPELKEEIIGNIEIRETFKISKVGTIAGCMVIDGKIHRNSSVRLIRDGVVIYTGELGSLKRFKDDVKEVAKGFECGLNIKNFNDIKVGDIIEVFEEVEVKKSL